MPTRLEHLRNIRFGVSLFAVALFGAMALVNIIQLYSDDPYAYAPLIYTLMASTLATMLVGVLTAGVATKAREMPAEEIQRHAAAAYVLSNAAGTVVSLIGHIGEVIETGWADKKLDGVDALSIILAKLGLSAEWQYYAYVGVVVLVIAASIWMVRCAASVTTRAEPASGARLAAVSAASLFLLLIGILIGTTWAITTDDPDLVNAAPGGVLMMMAVSIYLLIYAILIANSMLFFALLFGLSAIRLTHAVTDEETVPVIKRIFVELGHAVRLTAFGMFIVAVVAMVPTWIIAITGPRGAGFELGTVVAFGLWRAVESVAWALGAAVLVLLARLFGIGFLGALWAASIWTVGAVHGIIKFLVAGSFNLLRGTVSGLATLIGWIASGFKGQPKPTVESGAGGATQDKADQQTEDAAKPAVLEKPPTRFPLATFAKVLGGLTLVAALVFAVPLLGPKGTPQPTDLPDGSPQPPGFEDATAEAVTMCEALPGGFDWVLASDDRLEIALADCDLPEKVKTETDGVLVVVSVASFSNRKAIEIDRATRRARALSVWASRKTPTGMPIYVLNLGMANSERSFSIGWSAFGIVRGERPVLGLLLTPYPDGTSVPVPSILEELQNGLRYARVSDSFSSCDLSKFDSSAPPGSELVPVDGFDCVAK